MRLSRPFRRFAGGLMVFLGFVLVGDAVMTAAWEDPFTALGTRNAQKALSRKLAADERAPLPLQTLALIERLVTRQQRMAALARRLEHRARPGDPLGRISIPRAHSNFVFVSGTTGRTLKKGPGHYRDTPLPGQRGTVGLAGHRTTYAAPFRRLDRLRRGNRIVVTMPYGRFFYRVEGSRIVLPDSVGVLRRVKHDRLVLTTCHPLFSAKKRLVVTARLVEAIPRGNAVNSATSRPHVRRHARSHRSADRRAGSNRKRAHRHRQARSHRAHRRR
jgi:sortase A